MKAEEVIKKLEEIKLEDKEELIGVRLPFYVVEYKNLSKEYTKYDFMRDFLTKRKQIIYFFWDYLKEIKEERDYYKILYKLLDDLYDLFMKYIEIESLSESLNCEINRLEGMTFNVENIKELAAYYTIKKIRVNEDEDIYLRKKLGVDNINETEYENNKNKIIALNLLRNFHFGEDVEKKNIGRKYILVQLPEKCDEKSAAYTAGYKNICELGKERIRRAGKKIKEDNPNLIGLDTGFRVFKLDSSNMKDCYYSAEETTQELLSSLEENIKEDRTEEDLLIQVMLDMGIELSAKIEKVEIEKKIVYKVNGDKLLCCFESNLTNEVLTAIAKEQPEYAVFRDSCMQELGGSFNVDEIFKAHSKNTIVKIL